MQPAIMKSKRREGSQATAPSRLGAAVEVEMAISDSAGWPENGFVVPERQKGLEVRVSRGRSGTASCRGHTTAMHEIV